LLYNKYLNSDYTLFPLQNAVDFQQTLNQLHVDKLSRILLVTCVTKAGTDSWPSPVLLFDAWVSPCSLGQPLRHSPKLEALPMEQSDEISAVTHRAIFFSVW